MAALTVERQLADPDSTLALYRRALRIRRAEPALGDGELRWCVVPGAGDHVIAFERPGSSGSVVAVMNLGETAVALPPAWSGELLLASDGTAATAAGLALEPDAAVWLRWSRRPGGTATPSR